MCTKSSNLYFITCFKRNNVGFVLTSCLNKFKSGLNMYFYINIWLYSLAW